ncbi:MAG: TetR/AcrR family transcriptional regulator [Actinomycetota bacterium]
MTRHRSATFGSRFALFTSGEPQVPADASREDRILDAARRCFVAIGWDKTTMEDVGRLAGMSRATLYKIFPTSHDVHNAVRRQSVEMMRLDLNDALAGGRSLAESLGNVAAALTVWCSTVRSNGNPNAFYVQRHAEESVVIVDLLADVLRPRLELAQKNGEIDTDRPTDRVVDWVARCVAGFVLLPTGRPFHSDDPDIVRDFIRDFLVPAL